MSSLRLAVRRLGKTPVIATVAIVSLALGIGANAAVFSLFEQVLLQKLPVAQPDQLVNIDAPGPKAGDYSCTASGPCSMVLSYPMFRDLESAERTGFSGIAGHRLFTASIARGTRTVAGAGLLVSGSYFGVLGVRAALGRLVQPEDDRVIGGQPVAVLDHGFWQNELGGDRGVLNGTITVNGTTLVIVGVAPAAFRGTTLGARPAVYVPLTLRGRMEPGPDGFADRSYGWIYAFGRLGPGVSPGQAQDRINRVYTAIIRETEAPLLAGVSERTRARFREKQLVLRPGHRGQSRVHGRSRVPLALLLGMTTLVLLIACANIANLLLARGAGRAREMAVRSSLGATRGRLLTLVLCEALLLTGVGGLAALAVAQGTLAAVGALLPPSETAMLELTLDPGIMAFAAAIALATGILTGLVPALAGARPDLMSGLRLSAGDPTARSSSTFRSGLVTFQLALSLALLATAGLFARSFINVAGIDVGMEASDVVTFSVSPGRNGYEPERSRVLFDRLQQELAALPGVRGVASAAIPVLAGRSSGRDVDVQGFDGGPDVDRKSRYNHVGPGFFHTLGIPVIAGREFDLADRPERSRVAVVNEAFADKFGLARDAVVGSLMALRDDDDGALDIEIVGLVQNAKYDFIKDAVEPQFFLPHGSGPGTLSFYVRAEDPGAIAPAVPDVVRALDPALPVEHLALLDDLADQNVFMDRLIVALAGAFAALATLLAAIGLYGVVAYSVARRTREIGLRIALGADGRGVRRMVLGRVTRMLVVGGAAGLGAALAIGAVASSLLYGVNGHDPYALVGAAALLAAVALAAGYAPAIRASRIQPMEALRLE